MSFVTLRTTGGMGVITHGTAVTVPNHSSISSPPFSLSLLIPHSSIGVVVVAASAAMFSRMSSLSSLPSLSSSLRPPSPSRSHALCPHFFLFLLLVSSQSTTASPYYEREWNGAAEDDVPVLVSSFFFSLLISDYLINH